MTRIRLLALVILSAVFLAACESDEEKAERYYQSGLALLEEGEVERALIEFRNVFNHDGFHKEARKIYADTVLEQGDRQTAYGQYLRLIEQYPDTVEVRQILGELALETGNWEEVERHGGAAIELAPDDPRSRALAATLAYRAAALDEDTEAEALALAEARAVLEDAPESIVALRIVIDALARGRTPTAALPDLDRALEIDPESLEFRVIKFRVLTQAEREDEAEAVLEEMYALEPDNTEVRDALVQWYLARQDFDAAEEVLRNLAGPRDGETGGHVALIQFLRAARGSDVARTELEALITANEGQEAADLYRSILASLDFEEGRREEAILTLQNIVDGAEATDQTRRIKTALARMMIQIDNPVGGRALVEEVLAEDSGNVEALKIRAEFLINEDRPDDAINDLRTAQRQAPRDPQIMTLMATAFERSGSRELAGERLALAVDISGAAPEESIRYAAFLRQDDRIQAAESVLLDARRANPGNVQVVQALADLWLSAQDWTNLQGLLAALEGANTELALELATRIRTAMLVRQNRSDDLLDLLQNQAVEGEEALRNTVTIILTQVRAGKVDEARASLDAALAETPEAFELRLVDAALRQLTGDIDGSEAGLRDMIADFPDREQPVRMLYSLLVTAERRADAEEVLDAALTVQPDNLVLKWIKAGNLEQAGDIDGAIGIYEEMYALNSANMIVANNLASLLATHRADAESLDRAWAVARRLRGQEVPAFQDTYGWIATRRGDPEEALPYLEAAADGLPEDPLVQYHLGMTYLALDRTEQARATLTRALEIAGDSDLPQFDRAREALAGLDEAPATGETTGETTETQDQ